jgi:hypothetical protein
MGTDPQGQTLKEGNLWKARPFPFLEGVRFGRVSWLPDRFTCSAFSLMPIESNGPARVHSVHRNAVLRSSPVTVAGPLRLDRIPLPRNEAHGSKCTKEGNCRQ